MLPDRVRVKKGAFDFTQIYTEMRKASSENRKNAEESYIAVSYYKSDSSSAREYYLLQSRKFLAELLFSARNKRVPPSNEFEKRSHDRIEAFWKNNPYVYPDNMDTVGDK